MAAVTPSYTIPSLWIRLLIALILGLQAGFFIVFNLSSLFPIPVTVLLGALLLSIVLDPAVVRFDRPARRAVCAFGRALLGIGGLVVVGAVLVPLGGVGMSALPLVLGMLVSFTVGSKTTVLAIGSGMLAWAGMGSLIVVAAYQSSQVPGNDFGGLILGIAIIVFLIGFGLAAGGGLLGRALRRWAVR